jgi:hypothetical protein
MPEAWYEVVGAASPLTQGDLIFDCPLLTWDSAAAAPAAGSSPGPALTDPNRAFREDVVLMTRSYNWGRAATADSPSEPAR